MEAGRFERLFDTDGPTDRSVLASGSVLLVLLFLVSPLLTTTFRLVLPAFPETEFVAIGVSGLVFGGYLLASRTLVAGVVAAFFVLGTVRINVPLGPSSSLVAGVGPHLWLVHVPLLGLVAYYLQKRRTPGLSVVHLLYAGFVCWSLLAALVGNGPRPDIALFFTLFVFQAGVVFLLATWVTVDGLVSFGTAILLLCIAVVGHSIIGSLQFLNRGALGYPHHGEAARVPVESLNLGPIGTFPIGPHVNGFAYGGPLTVLITLVLPIVIAIAIHERGTRRFLAVAASLLLIFVQRVTAWDAGRGGALVGMCALVLLLLWTFRSDVRALLPSGVPGSFVATATGVLILGITALPGSKAGTATSLPTATDDARADQGSSRDAPTGTETASPSTATGGDSASTDTPVQTGTEPASPPTTTGSDSASSGTPVQTGTPSGESFSIPLFDASNLGIRLQQYIEAIRLSVEYPLFGIGGANFSFVAPQTSLDRAYWLHNMYLQVLVGTGVPGFFLYCGTIALVLFFGVRLLRLPGSDSFLVIGVLAGVIGVLAQVNFNPELHRMASTFTFWAVSGLLIGEYQRLQGPEPTRSGSEDPQ
jgi:hypothetical protein